MKQQSEEGSGPERKKRKINKDESLPTATELNQMRDTENLFHSNMFRMQIEELLKEITITEKFCLKFEEWFTKFKTSVQEMKLSKEHKLSSTEWLNKLKVSIPISLRCEDYSGNFQFHPPKNIMLIGSYASGTALSTNLCVDVMIEMPETFIVKGDNFIQKYFWKRALYLAIIASRLRKNNLIEHEELKYCVSHGDEVRPLLRIKPIGKLGKFVTIILHLSTKTEQLKPKCLSPSYSNIKLSWLSKNKEKKGKSDIQYRTPHYNSSILQDLTMIENENKKEVLKHFPNIQNGIKLLKVWMHQRGMLKGYGSFNGHVLTMFALHLLNTRRLNGSMSSYQVVRYAWNILAQSDWTKSGIVFGHPENSALDIQMFHDNYEVVFLDATGNYNLCSFMTKETFLQVKLESSLALEYLNNCNMNSFASLFLTPVPFCRQFDHLVCFHEPLLFEKAVRKHSKDEVRVDYCDNFLNLFLVIILKLLRRGLGNRISRMCIKSMDDRVWKIDEDPLISCNQPIIIGLSLDTEFAFNVLEKGPQANLPEANEFQAFWKEKSQLRRFKDGSILECVSWLKDDETNKHLICKEIISHLLRSHLGIDAKECLTYIADQVNITLQVGWNFSSHEETVLSILQSFDRLSKDLQNIKDLPLDLTNIQGISPVFRYTDPFPSSFSSQLAKNKDFVEKNDWFREVVNPNEIELIKPIEAVVNLGYSGKWPNDHDAFRRIIAAFCIRIADSLKKQLKLKTLPTTSYIDVWKDDLLFRLHIFHSRELKILQQVKIDGLLCERNTDESIALKREKVDLPKLSVALHGLQMQYNCFAPTSCLAKRWLRSHLFDEWYISDIVIELLVSSLFLQPDPYLVPHESQVAFIRFLSLLSQTDWNTYPLILNFNDEISRTAQLEIEKKFQASRSSFPPIFIATPYDLSGTLWTANTLELFVLIRIAKLATEGIRILQEQLTTKGDYDYKIIFRPIVDEYNVSIFCDTAYIRRRSESLDPFKVSSAHNSFNDMSDKVPLIAYDPIQEYLQELRKAYSSIALFFHDTYGGNVIRVVWKPLTNDVKSFAVSQVNCRKLEKSDVTKLVFDYDAVIEDFYVIGSGLVKSIEVRPS